MKDIGLVLRKAERNDAGDIAELNNSSLTVKQTQGFLLAPIKVDEFAEYIENHPDFVLVAEASARVLVGFLQLSRSAGSHVIQRLDWRTSQSRSMFEGSEALYIEKVAVKGNYKRLKIGTQLYNSVFDRHPKCLFYSFAARKPFANKASLCFHKKLGFCESAIFRAERYLGLQNYESVMLTRASEESR